METPGFCPSPSCQPRGSSDSVSGSILCWQTRGKKPNHPGRGGIMSIENILQVLPCVASQALSVAAPPGFGHGRGCRGSLKHQLVPPC